MELPRPCRYQQPVAQLGGTPLRPTPCGTDRQRSRWIARDQGWPGTITGVRGTRRYASTAPASTAAAAAAATADRWASCATAGPATAPRRVAAASPARKTAVTRPSAALRITRWTAVWGTTSDIEPNMP